MPTGIYKRTEAHRGSNHGRWKGDDAGYISKHKWVSYHFNKPQQCENCGLDKMPDGKRRYFEWANISGKYLRKRNDWKRLCKACHQKMDWELRVRGETHGMAKLKNSDIPLIRELLIKSHLTHRRIAKIFGVTKSTITLIANGKTWKHIS